MTRPPTTTHAPLHVIEVRGDSAARGRQHGRLLRKPIERAVGFYRAFFAKQIGLSPDEMRRRAARFIEPTAAMSNPLAAEMQGIAEGSGQSLEDIYALSARYEITYESLRLGECSNMFVGAQRSTNGHALLGMNWEWRPEVMDFRAVITARCDDVPDHVVVTECGQPGKYGLNEHGVAAIETGLGCSRNTGTGRALFCAVVRHVLQQPSLARAIGAVRAHPPEATISFFIADDRGDGVNLECSPSGVAERRLAGHEIIWHTNHCRLTDEPCSFEDSHLRGARWESLIGRAAPAVDWETVGRWLADTENGTNAICKAPDPALAGRATYLQTLASIVLDPAARAIWVSDGPSFQAPYRRFALEGHEP